MGADVTLLSPAEKTIGVRAQLIFLSPRSLDLKEINCDLTPIESAITWQRVRQVQLELRGLLPERLVQPQQAQGLVHGRRLRRAFHLTCQCCRRPLK